MEENRINIGQAARLFATITPKALWIFLKVSFVPLSSLMGFVVRSGKANCYQRWKKGEVPGHFWRVES